MADVGKIESLKEYETGTSDGEYLRWQMEVQTAEKELGKWHREARKIVKQFRAKPPEVSGVDPNYERRFNLFSANVGIMQTALLNQVPKPSVNREFKDPQDDVGRVACEIMERALMAHNNKGGFKTFNILKQIVQDSLVPGVGLSWHTYHADIEDRVSEPTEEELSLDPERKPMKYQEVVGEELRDEYVYWEDLLWSPARTYAEVRWLARKLYMTRDKCTKRFGSDVGKKIALEYNPKKSENSVETKHQVFQQAIIYEIWDKESKQVIWWSKGYDKILDQKDDYLELEDFFPCPQPLMSLASNGEYIPLPDYTFAKDQYRELNEINTRISLLVRACRVAGTYDKSNGALPNLVNNAAENTLVPVDQWAAFAEKGGIKGVIDFLPLDQIVKTIEQLLAAREDIKAQIYEVTGMSDIIRGTSKASETLGAQKLKAQYASMRIQDRQKQIVMYSSSVFDIQAQLFRKHMDISEIAKLAQVQFMNEDQTLIDQALELIKNPDFLLRCQVESDSLSDIDFQAEKQDRMEYMTTITNYLKEMLPTIQNDPLMGPLALQLLQFSLAGFKIGKKFEGELDKTFSQILQKLANPQPPQKTPEEKKIEAEIAAKEKESQLKQQEMQQELGFKKQEHQFKLQSIQQEAQVKARASQQKMALDQQNSQQKAAQSQQKFQVDMYQQQVRAMQPVPQTEPKRGA